MQNTVPELITPANNLAKTDMPDAPQLPKSAEVDKDVALKYLDVYQNYISTYAQSQERADKKKRPSVSSNSDVSLAPSMSASHRGQAVPAIVRVDSRDSCLTYTPPNLPSEYTGLIVSDRTRGPGFCYLSLIRDEHRMNIGDQLGRYPTFESILKLGRDLFITDDQLSRLQISCIAPGTYHVVTGTIMPNVISTLAAIVRKCGTVISEGSTMYEWVSTIIPPDGLSEHAPSLHDVLGSSRSSRRYRYRPVVSPPRPGRPIHPSYDRYPSSRPSSSSPPHIDYEYREPRSERSRYGRGSLFEDDLANGRPITVRAVEPRSGRRYHYLDNDSMDYGSIDYGSFRPYERSRRSSRPYNRYDNDNDNDSDYDYDYDYDYERALRISAAEHRRSQSDPSNNAFNLDSISRVLDESRRRSDDLAQSIFRNASTSRPSQVSSAGSTSSTRIWGSVQSATCDICTDTIGEGAGVLPCGHMFHAECVDRWLAESDTCPQCRART